MVFLMSVLMALVSACGLAQDTQDIIDGVDWSVVVKASNDRSLPCFKGDSAHSFYERPADGEFIRWQSAVVTEKRKGEKVTFIMASGMGSNLGEGFHELFMNGRKILEINTSYGATINWKSELAAGQFETTFIDENNDIFGIFSVTVNSEAIEYGKSQNFEMKGKVSPGNGWFSISKAGNLQGLNVKELQSKAKISDQISKINGQIANQIWQTKYGSGKNNFLRGLVLDKQKNVYATGYSFNGANFDCLTIKYDQNGKKVWEERYDGGGSDAGYGIAIDSRGNLCVAGFSNNGTNDDYLIIKYDPKGRIAWQKKQDYGDDDWAFGIAVDSHDHVYATGSSGTKSWITTSYDSNGKERWRTGYTNGGGFGSGVAVNSKGNVYVTGNKDQVIKYDSNGNLLWEKKTPFPAPEWEEMGLSARIVADVQSNIYVAGTRRHKTTSDRDIFLVKYNANDDVAWKTYYDGHGNDFCFAVAIDSGGGIYISGLPNDYALIKYDSNGKLLWKKALSIGIKSYAVACDADDNIYIGGSSPGKEQGNYIIMKLPRQ